VHTDRETPLEIVGCPDCGRPALVEWRTHIESTHGAVEHLKSSASIDAGSSYPLQAWSGRRIIPPQTRHDRASLMLMKAVHCLVGERERLRAKQR
jgi:hypothetical protein